MFLVKASLAVEKKLQHFRWLALGRLSGKSYYSTGPATPLEIVQANRDRLQRSNDLSPAEKNALHKVPLDEHSADGLYRSAKSLGNVIGFLSVPMAVVGPLMVNGRTCHIPMAVSDASLIAKASRGCKALEAAGGVQSRVIKDGLVQTPVVVLPSVFDASAFATFVEDPIRVDDLKHWFTETTGAAELGSVKCQVMGRRVLVRFNIKGGDNTGIDSVSKGIERVLTHLREEWTGNSFHVVEGTVESVEECGKTVSAEIVLPNDIIESILRTDANTVLALSAEKLALRSTVIGGLTARRITSSVLLATGQDLVGRAQEMPTFSTLIEPVKSCLDQTVNVGVRISCMINSIDVGTTALNTGRYAAQQACLNMLGVAGSNVMSPGENSQRLAEIISAAALAGEVGSIAKFSATTEDLVKYSQQQFKTASQPSSSRSRAPAKRTSLQSPPVPEAARGVSSIKLTAEPKNLLNAAATLKTHPAYLELVAEKCAVEFGWADPRLTVP